MKRKPTLKVTVARVTQERNDARGAIVQLQEMVRDLADAMRRAQDVLRCAAELHDLHDSAAHAQFARKVADSMSRRIGEASAVADLDVDAAITHLIIPF